MFLEEYRVRKSAIKISGNDFKIIGDGEQTIITIPGQDTITWGAILEIRDSDNWELRDITIDGNWNNVPGNAQQGIANLIIRRSNYWVIDNVIGQNNWYGNIQMGDITHAVIRNSKSINTDCAIITYADTSDVLVENNFMDGHHWSEPIAFYAGNHNNIIIRGNTLKNKGYAHAILIGKSDRSSEVHQNILIENNNLYKVNGGVGVLYGINKDIIIRENIIYAQNDPINVKNGENIVIEDNNLDASWGGVPGSKGGQTWTGADNPSSKGHNGILIASSNGVSIQNNDISGYGWNCIYDGGSSNVEKLNNECS